jgi:endogenous inhibitor of DNA gyrase (YacG/DUF329 family)
MTQAKIVACPQCKKSSVYDTSNKFRPFCSKRCKEFDIASWASEHYVVKGTQQLSPEEMAHVRIREDQQKTKGSQDDDGDS